MLLVREEEARKHPERYLDGYPDLLMDDEVAIVSEQDFARLPEYSASVPTGVCDGKVWSRNLAAHGGSEKGWLFMFFEHDEGNQFFVRHRRLIITGSVEFWDWLTPGIWDG